MNNRYGIIRYTPDRQPGGIGRYTSELITALRGLGVPLTVLQAGRTDDAASVSLPGARLLPGLMTLGQAQIALAAQRHQLALVHDPIGVSPLLLTGARRVTTIHDVIPYIYPDTSTMLDRLIYQHWLPLAVRRMHVVITVSEQSRIDILRHLPLRPEQVVVIPEAAARHYRVVEPPDVQPVLARYGVERPYILYVGSIEARKNLARLLEAFAQLLGWSQRWQLVVVGAKKWKFSPVFETVQRLGLQSHVHFTGYVDDDDLPALYAGADLFVFPSLYEGFGLPVLEAMACGTPVVTSDCSSLPEVAGDAALLVNPVDVAALAVAMRQVLDNQVLAQTLRARGLARARHFSWDHTARKTLAVYQRVLSETR